MEAPATTASRLLLAAGFALLLATGFALIDGRLPPAECLELEGCVSSGFEGWLVPTAGVLCLIAGYSLQKGVGSSLHSLFPKETADEQLQIALSESNEASDEDLLSDAWAKLEEGLLTDKVEEE